MQRSLLDFAQLGWEKADIEPAATFGTAGPRADFAAMNGSDDWFAWHAGRALREAGLGPPAKVGDIGPVPGQMKALGPPNVALVITPRGGPKRRVIFAAEDDRATRWTFARLGDG